MAMKVSQIYTLTIAEKRKLRAIAESFGAEVRFHEGVSQEALLGAYLGEYIGKYEMCVIYINHPLHTTRDLVYSTFFHELQHHINKLEKREGGFYPSKVDLANELYTDKLAKFLMYEYFPELTYIPGYPDETIKRMIEKDRAWLRELSPSKSGTTIDLLQPLIKGRGVISNTVYNHTIDNV